MCFLHLPEAVRIYSRGPCFVSLRIQSAMGFDHFQWDPRHSLPNLLCPYCSGARKESSEALALENLEKSSESTSKKTTHTPRENTSWPTKLDARLNEAYKICSARHICPLPQRLRDSAASTSTERNISTVSTAQ